MIRAWTFRREEHLGSRAYSLFDPHDERSAVGLTYADARAICEAMNDRKLSPTPALSDPLTDTEEANRG